MKIFKIFRIFTRRFWALRRLRKYYLKKLYSAQDEVVPVDAAHLAKSKDSFDQRYYKQYVADFYKNKSKKVKQIQKKINKLKY